MLRLISLALWSCAADARVPSEPVGNDWYDLGRQWLESRKAIFESERVKSAKNAIIFIGGGMDPLTCTAARMRKGQLAGGDGFKAPLSWETFPNAGLAMTYSLDTQVADSAATATAILTGAKTNQRRIGLTASGAENCPRGQANEGRLYSIGEWAKSRGKGVGIVTNMRITHATPAGMYGHLPDRDYEHASPNECRDLATQLLESQDWDVALGGGRRSFVPEEDGGLRRDGADLIQTWLAGDNSRTFVNDTSSLLAADSAPLLGLFAESHMGWAGERPPEQPSLTEMTAKALEILKSPSRFPNGYILLVESGLIGHGHQLNQWHEALGEMMLTDAAVAEADSLMDNETLLLVTANHGHTTTLAGYSQDGNPILGLSIANDYITGEPGDKPFTAPDYKPYTTLGYYNGPGGGKRSRTPVGGSGEDTRAPHYVQEANVYFEEGGTNGGQDVGVWAKGPGSELVASTFEQNYIFFVLDEALGLRPNLQAGRRAAALPLVATSSPRDPISETTFENAKNHIATLQQHNKTAKPAKSAIIFIGDGMDPLTVAATRFRKGQKAGGSGEGTTMSWDSFRDFAFSKTHNTNQQTPDSAGTATAMLSGAKTRAYAIGVDSNTRPTRCHEPSSELSSVAEWAKSKGMGIGVVTTTRITHATPACVYAHIANRNWESDADVDEAVGGACKSIAQQMLDWDVSGATWDVALGGGMSKFTSEQLAGWQQRWGGTLVTTKTELEGADSVPLLGLFADSHLEYKYSKEESQPSLEDMVPKALDLLMDEERFPNGYILVVESGLIDISHHWNSWFNAFEETLDMDAAVDTAYARTKDDDTLIVVTADHGHTTTWSGYSHQGHPILGVATPVKYSGPTLADDNKTYTCLGYASGPDSTGGWNSRQEREIENETHPPYLQESFIPYWGQGAHGGQDVGVWVTGPRAHLFGGVLEQNSIFHAVTEALDLWNRPSMDTSTSTTAAPTTTAQSSGSSGELLVYLLGALVAALLGFLLVRYCILNERVHLQAPAVELS